MNLDTPRIFMGLYQLYRRSGHDRLASFRLVWQRIRHRLY